MTLSAPPTGADVYVPHVDHDAKFEAARRAVQEEQDALAAHEAALEARNAAVNAALDVAPLDMSDNEVARQLGLNGSTFRSITGDLRKARRTRRRS